MTASKTYATNRELGLNSNGVRVPYQHRGAIQPMAEGSDSYVVNDAGTIQARRGQKAWRVHCDEPGDFGGCLQGLQHYREPLCRLPPELGKGLKAERR